MEDPMAAIRVTFFQECDEQLAELENGLLAMQDGTAEAETVNAVFRAVHSMKGGAGIFALDALVRFAHVFETALDKVRSGMLAASPPVVAVFLRAADLLADLVRAARDGLPADEARIAEMTQELSRAGGAGETNEPAHAPRGEAEASEPGKPSPQIWHIRFTPHAELYAKANEAAVLLRELRQLGQARVTLDASRLPDLPDIDPEGAYLSWGIELESARTEKEIRDLFEFVEEDCELEITPSSQGFAPGEVITGDNGFKFEFFGPPEEAADHGGEEREAEAEPEQHGPAARPPSAIPAAAPPLPPPPAAPSPPPLSAASKSERAGVTIRVELDRVDRMVDLMGELVINEAMLTQNVVESGLAHSSKLAMTLESLETLTREIQDSVMAIRAQPVRSVFQRMPRLVREVAAMTGKQVRLVTEGEATEVDKTVIERISDPLTHMIRNAIDHGLESPEARVVAGKPPEGTVRLTALHRSGRIVLEVEDDGAGIDRARVRQKAVEKGLIDPAAQLSDEETDNLIFLPGFSTAAAVSDISGRGVGMDVVRQSVQALGGRISIASRPGRGSTFTLSLPLTLAVMDGMVVSTHGHTLIIPLSAIVETLKPRAEDVFPLDAESNLLASRGCYVPMVDTASCLGYGVPPATPEDCVALLVEGEGGGRTVLLVDAIHGQRQVVIKSLEANYRAVPGIAAATVMGDGQVALIVDVDAVIRVAGAASATRTAAPKIMELQERAA